MTDAPEVLRFLREFVAEAPDEVGIMANLRLAPPLPIIPEEARQANRGTRSHVHGHHRGWGEGPAADHAVRHPRARHGFPKPYVAHVARVPDEDAAFPNRAAAHDINIVAAWKPDHPEPERHIDWVRGFFGALEPHSRGVYVNFTGDDSNERVRSRAYSSAQWSRLVGLKAKFDPTNFFRLNANIPPTED